MTDRELLELAMFAWGYTDPTWDDDIWLHVESGENHQVNPLEDDGDALRLSIKLKINIEHSGKCIDGRAIGADRVQASPRGNGHLAWVQEYKDSDSVFSATRLAIVRAAAEIGKSMKENHA